MYAEASNHYQPSFCTLIKLYTSAFFQKCLTLSQNVKVSKRREVLKDQEWYTQIIFIGVIQLLLKENLICKAKM